MTALLEAIDVRKCYGDRVALAGVSLAVRAGEVVGLLGPNGAGKTTLLSVLAAIKRPDSGRVAIGGEPADGRRSRRSSLGLVPQGLALYPSLTALQNVWHFARVQGLTRAEAEVECPRALAEVGLAERAHDATHGLSGGMLRRLNLACGMVHRPAVLLLDEPTVGVDLESREQLLTQVRSLRDAGSAVIYSTHYMEEAERVCDRVLLIDRGRLVAAGTVEALIELAGGRTRMDLTYRGPLDGLAELAGVRLLPASARDGRMSLELASPSEVGRVLEALARAGARVLDFSLHSPNLADAFVALTGRSLQDPSHV